MSYFKLFEQLKEEGIKEVLAVEIVVARAIQHDLEKSELLFQAMMTLRMGDSEMRANLADQIEKYIGDK